MDVIPTATRGYWAGVWRRLRRDKTAMVCLAVIVLIVLCAVFAPLISPGDPFVGSALQRLKPIGTPGHPLGTDELGRDMLTRLLYGMRYHHSERGCDAFFSSGWAHCEGACERGAVC